MRPSALGLSAAAAAVLVLSLTACAGGTTAEPSGSSSSRPPFQTTTPGPITPTGTPTDVPTAKWDAIVADLEGRGVSGSDPELVSATLVTWPNGALGCPQPGQNYTQALVDGMQVIVTVDGTTYDYRFGTSDTPKLCER